MVPFGLQNFLNKGTVVRPRPYFFESAILLRPRRPEGRNYPSFWGAARRAKGERLKAKWRHPKMKGNSMPKAGPQENCRFKSVGLRAHYSGPFREILEPKRYHLFLKVLRAPGAALQP